LKRIKHRSPSEPPIVEPHVEKPVEQPSGDYEESFNTVNKRLDTLLSLSKPPSFVLDENEANELIIEMAQLRNELTEKTRLFKSFDGVTATLNRNYGVLMEMIKGLEEEMTAVKAMGKPFQPRKMESAEVIDLTPITLRG